jgi:hypothetical protein
VIQGGQHSPPNLVLHSLEFGKRCASGNLARLPNLPPSAVRVFTPYRMRRSSIAKPLR